MIRTPESMANVAYTRYVLDIGMFPGRSQSRPSFVFSSGRSQRTKQFSFVLKIQNHVGMTGDLLDLGLAIAPCLIGYGQIGNRLYNDPNTVKGDTNPYWEWIKNYHDSDYQSAVTRGIGKGPGHCLQILIRRPCYSFQGQ